VLFLGFLWVFFGLLLRLKITQQTPEDVEADMIMLATSPDIDDASLLHLLKLQDEAVQRLLQEKHIMYTAGVDLQSELHRVEDLLSATVNEYQETAARNAMLTHANACEPLIFFFTLG
jgi:hypothetical protein